MELIKYFAFIFSIIAIIALAFWMYHRQSLRIPNPMPTEGEVVEIVPMLRFRNAFVALLSTKKQEEIFHPVVRFKVEEGKAVRFRNRVGFEKGTYKVGDKVKIMYSKDNPLLAKIEA